MNEKTLLESEDELRFEYDLSELLKLDLVVDGKDDRIKYGDVPCHILFPPQTF